MNRDYRNEEGTQRELNGVVYFERGPIQAGGESYDRLAVQTHFVERGEDYIELIKKYIVPIWEDGDILSISEKVIGMCQNNVVEMKDVHPGWWAKKLSGIASSSAAGPGLSEVHKMQLAIDLAGLPRILFACFCHAIGKLFGKKGVFYKVAGHGIAGIDGFYPKASFELYKTAALLNPREPNKVCAEIEEKTGVLCYIVDANDLTREILGVPPKKPVTDKVFLEMIEDNPAGQANELTPLILIRRSK